MKLQLLNYPAEILLRNGGDALFSLLTNCFFYKNARVYQQKDNLQKGVSYSSILNIPFVLWDLKTAYQHWSEKAIEPFTFVVAAKAWSNGHKISILTSSAICAGIIYFIAKSFLDVRKTTSMNFTEEQENEYVNITTSVKGYIDFTVQMHRFFSIMRITVNLALAFFSRDHMYHLMIAASQAYNFYKSGSWSGAVLKKTFDFVQLNQENRDEQERAVSAFIELMIQSQMYQIRQQVLFSRRISSRNVEQATLECINLLRERLKKQIWEQLNRSFIRKIQFTAHAMMVPSSKNDECNVCLDKQAEVYACANHTICKECWMRFISTRVELLFSDIDLKLQTSSTGGVTSFKMSVKAEHLPNCHLCREYSPNVMLTAAIGIDQNRTIEMIDGKLEVEKRPEFPPVPSSWILNANDYLSTIRTVFEATQALVSEVRKRYPELSIKIPMSDVVLFYTDIWSIVIDIVNLHAMLKKK